MPLSVLTAIFVSPHASAAVASGASPALERSLRDKAASGIIVFLSAATGLQARGLERWFTGLEKQERPNVRLVTPGFFVWPGGRVRLPLDTTAPEDAISVAHDLAKQLASGSGITVETQVDDGFLAVASDAPLPSDFVEDLGTRLRDHEIIPRAPDELEAVEQGTRLVTVLAPINPSEAWDGCVRLAERLHPTRLLVVSAVEERSTAIERFVASLQAAASRAPLDGSDKVLLLPVDLAADAALPADQFRVEVPRIVAPSEIHFIRRWSAENRRYVRGHYWEATNSAKRNVERANKLLAELDNGRFRRAADVERLAREAGGARLFDDFSGAVCFDPGFYEFELSKQTGSRPVDFSCTRMLAYFDAKHYEMPFDRPLLKRRMFTNSLVLMRGESYYANLKQLPPWVRARDYNDEAKELASLFSDFQKPEYRGAIERCLDGGAQTEAAWKLLLGVFDQVRNIGLTMLSVAAFRWGDQQGTTDDVLLERASTLVRAYYTILLGDSSISAPAFVQQVLEGLGRASMSFEAIAKDEEARARHSTWYEPGVPIRGWREADAPYENLLTALLALDGRSHERTAALGMFWGGVELPIAASVAADALGYPLGIWGFMRLGRYSSAAVRDEAHFCDLGAHQWRSIGDLAAGGISRLLLMDDNALSGATLEAARDLLLATGVGEVETWIVRFSGERREGQMRMANGGIVHPAYLSERLHGFLGETPYARSYSRKQYESPVGVFNTARSRILRYLHNNGFASIFEREGF